MAPPPPMAIPLIVGYAAASGMGLIAGTLAFTAVSAIVSYGVSALMKSSASDSTPQISDFATTQPGAGRTQQFRQPTPPHDVVVGRIKKSGPVMFMQSGPDDTGRVDGYFYIDIVLASHHCKRIECTYFGDLLSTDATFTGLYTIGEHLGTTTQTEDATFVADLPTDYADHRLRGRCHIAVRLKGSVTAFPNDVPTIASILWGADEITDPRTGLTGWTNNAILIVYWWLIWGEGYTADDFDEAQLIASANVCDERVRVYGSTCTFSPVATADSPPSYADEITLSANARSLDVGDGVRVSTSGSLPAGLAADTTYYVYPNGGTIKLCTTVANAFAGTGIDITSAGTGTQTLQYWDEARYKCNGSFSLDAEKREIREQLLTSCAGRAVPVGGVWYLHAGAAATPTVTLGVDDLRGPLVTTPKRSIADRTNAVRAVFVNPDNGWQPSDAPPLPNAGYQPAYITAYLAEDNNAESSATLRTPFITSARQAQRLMKIALVESRLQCTVKFPAKLTAMRLRPMDGAYLTVERYSWDQAQYRVMGWALSDEGAPDLLLREDSADVYAWDYTTDEQVVSVPQGVTLPDPSTIAAPAAITVDTPTLPVYSRLNATITEVKSIWMDGYDVEFRAKDVAVWSSSGRISTNLISLVMAEATDIQVRAVTKNGTPSAFTQNLAPGVPTAVAVDGTDPLQINWTNGAGADTVQVFQGVDLFSESTLFATETATGPLTAQTLVVANNYHYWLRTVNATGNVSHPTDAVAIGTPGGLAVNDGGDGSDGGAGDAGDGDGDGEA